MFDSEALGRSVLCVVIGSVGDYNFVVRDAGIAQVLRLCGTLVAKANSAYSPVSV